MPGEPLSRDPVKAPDRVFGTHTLLVRATIDAEVEVQGFVFKADYYRIEDEVSLIDFDWNKHYAFVATTALARLVFQLRVEAGTRAVEDIEFEMAEGLVLPESQ